MSPAAQRRAALAAAAALAALFVGANLHLLAVALRSQPDCVAVAHADPARRAC